MEEREIVELYWRRDEAAVRETQRALGAYLTKIARNVLGRGEEAEEAVNDAYLTAWNTIPPERPDRLRLYLGKIVRDRAVDLLRRSNRQKRRPSQGLGSLEELSQCVPSPDNPEDRVDAMALRDAIGAYLRTLPERTRRAFIGRYYYMDSLDEIAGYLHISRSSIKSALYRARQGLREYLEKEGLM